MHLMRVVEVGCGDRPGPVFDGAMEYICVENDSEQINNAVRRFHADMTFVHANAANLEFPDQSVDVVVARNVFGAPRLGFTKSDRHTFNQIEISLAAQARIDEQEKFNQEVNERVNQTKLAIMREA